MSAGLPFVAAPLEHEAAALFLGIPIPVWQAVNLVLFIGLLVYFVKKPLVSFLTGRRREVEEAIQRAEENRRRAEELSREIAGRLAGVEGELAGLKARAREQAEADQAALLAQTEKDAARIVARASAEMESRVRAARAELTAYAGDLAVGIAADLLKKNVTPADQTRLVEEGVAALGAAAATRERA